MTRRRQTPSPRAAAVDMANITFYRVYEDGVAPMRADKSALGTLPASAYQYCEAVRTASSYGWYVFPPEDIVLKWNGADVFVRIEDSWEPLSSLQLPGLQEYWDERCPEGLRGMAPPFMTAVPVRGVVQIWSGLLVATAPGWSVLVRPVVNAPRSQLYSCYEGVVETDVYQPCPLFTNVQLIATDVPIELSRERPLFQVQPLLRETYSDHAHSAVEHVGLGRDSEWGGLSEEEWAGYRRTIRTDAVEDPHNVGDYAVATRKRAKRSSCPV